MDQTKAMARFMGRGLSGVFGSAVGEMTGKNESGCVPVKESADFGNPAGDLPGPCPVTADVNRHHLPGNPIPGSTVVTLMLKGEYFSATPDQMCWMLLSSCVLKLDVLPSMS